MKLKKIFGLILLHCTSTTVFSQIDVDNGRCGTHYEFNYAGQYHPTDLPFVATQQSAVGVLEHTESDRSQKFCSGILITPNYFLTAAHCIILSGGGNVLGKYVAFNYQVDQHGHASKQEHYRIASVISMGGMSSSHGAKDYAILKLDGNPGDKFGYVRPTIYDGNVMGIYSIHHPAAGLKVINRGYIFNSALYFNGTHYLSTIDMDVQPGSSGGAVFDVHGRLIGINSMGNCARTFWPTETLAPLSLQNQILPFDEIQNSDLVMSTLIHWGYSPLNPIFMR